MPESVLGGDVLEAGELVNSPLPPCALEAVAPFESGTPERGLPPNSMDFAEPGATPACAGDGHPGSRSEWLQRLTQCSSLVELGIGLAWGWSAGYAQVDVNRARPTRAARFSKGGLFPLPVSMPVLSFSGLAGLSPCEKLEVAIQCWVALGCLALNSMYGCPNEGQTRAPGKVHDAALKGLRSKVERFLQGEIPLSFSFNDAVEELKERKLSYTGEEILQPHCLTPEQILKGLPPIGHGGSIPILPFLKGRTKYLMQHPEESLLPLKDRGSSAVTAKVHIAKGLELEVFELLRSRGIISWIPADETFKDERGTYLSGLFGVVKPGKYTPSKLPVLRVIMNLVPINDIFSVMRGDIDCLPNATQWMSLSVDDGEFITLSQGDMASAFYLFAIPPCWQRYMCFNFQAKGCCLGVDGLEPGRLYRPACAVLPMGWSSSVGIMQAISREILISRGLPPSLEIRKGAPLPPWFAQVTSQCDETRSWWQVYLDNFMAADVSSEQLADHSRSLQEMAMRAWTDAGVLTAHDKQVVSQREITELGVRIDGERALLGGSPARLLKTIFVTIHHIMNKTWSRKECQIVLGRWIFLLQFRRAAMSILSRAWDATSVRWPTLKQLDVLHSELMALIFLGPLLQTDLSAGFDPAVTCSDASEAGGACAVSSGLSWSGKSFVGAKNDTRLRAIACPILIVSIFNGIGGAFRLYDILGIEPQGRISVEIDRHCNRVTRTAWPDVIELHDVQEITKEEVARWASLFPHIRELHLFAGFPCVHLSSVRAFRENLSGEGSRLFWKLLEVISWVQEVFGTYATVKFCIENVASMDESARLEISGELGISPIKLDPSDMMPYSRPRLAWCSEPLYEMEGVQLWKEREYTRAYLSGGTLVNAQWIRPGWTWDPPLGTCFPTFMKNIKRQVPPPQPAGLARTSYECQERWRKDQYRYPPYQYKDQFLLHQSGSAPRLLDASEREILLGFGPGHTSACMSASEAKKNYQHYEDQRCSQCGDSFSILSFAVMASAMAASMIPRMTPEQILLRLGLAPGFSAHPDCRVPMSRWLAYGGNPDLSYSDGELVRHLALTVNHTGADVRISSGCIMGKKSTSHGSARAWWWQWKHLFKTKWLFKSHINYLEMKMILMAILWKCRSPSAVNKRWLHLEDSMVCLYILSKGRTSSHLLQPLVQQLGAVQIAMGSTLLHAHVTSSENPTDAASRD